MNQAEPIFDAVPRKTTISMSVDRVFDVLELLCQFPGGLTQKEIGDRLDIPKSSASALLTTMVARYYLHLDPQRKLYFLGVMTYRLGSAYSDSNELDIVARPVMSEMQRLTGEVVNISVMQGRNVVLVGRIHSSFPLRVVPSLGAQTPAHVSASGKAILANLPDSVVDGLYADGHFERLTERSLHSLAALHAALAEVRRTGVALDNGESHEGIVAVGSVVLDAGGQALGGLSTVLPANRFDSDRRERLSRLVRLGARLISQSLGYLPALQEKHSLEHLARAWEAA